MGKMKNPFNWGLDDNVKYESAYNQRNAQYNDAAQEVFTDSEKVSFFGNNDAPTPQLKTVNGMDKLEIIFGGTVPSVVDIVKSDFATVKAIDKDAIYYETECVLNGPINTTENAKVSTLKNIFQVGEKVYTFNRNLESGDVSVDIVDDAWMGDTTINPNDIVISYEAAVKILSEADIVKPASDKMTLRQPLNPEFRTPLYIFGSNSTFFVAVDAISGEVKELDGTTL